MDALGTPYATKRRRANGKSINKPPPKDGAETKSNPSKRHRIRLNAELDTVASLLPYDQNIVSKLDRLSILRLAVSYLRTKSYFQVMTHIPSEKQEGQEGQLHHPPPVTRHKDLISCDHQILEGEMFLQALNGFLVILDCEGEVFYSTHNIESYLGFHQSDIVHQSVYELVHSEDREELQRQLLWNSHLPVGQTQISLQEALNGDQAMLERNFTVRFRCLLDNTSGFIRLDVRGSIKVLHGQNRKTEDPTLALFAICTPFGPPSLLELPQKEIMYKSKHKLDFSLVSMDQKGKMLLGYTDLELSNKGGYDLVHYDDLSYVASAHQELLKTGASGMIAYRLQTQDLSWQWLQTSSRLVYKNSKPEFVICTHRPLMEEEGRDLFGKRTMDFKVSYLDPSLTQSYLCDTELPQLYASRMSRKYKNHLRDSLSNGRTKRPYSNLTDAAYPTYDNLYGTSAYTADSSLYMHQNLSNLHSLYPASYLPPTDNLFHSYRQLGTYYPDYMTHGAYANNSYVDPTHSSLSYDTTGLTKTDTKLYGATQIDASKYQYRPTDAYSAVYAANSVLSPGLEPKYIELRNSAEPSQDNTALSSLGALASTTTAANNNSSTPTHKDESKISQRDGYNNTTRDTVLMWGNNKKYDPATSVSSTMSTVLDNNMSSLSCKWGSATPPSTSGALSSTGGSPHGTEVASPHSHSSSMTTVDHVAASHAVATSAASSATYVGAGSVASASKTGYGYYEGGGEVWHHQYYPYHPYYTTHSLGQPSYPQISRNSILCCPSLR